MQADNDPVVPVTTLARSPVPNARRRLLRGTFAAPTVLALSSGSALANTSSLRCFDNMPPDFSRFTAGIPGNFFHVKRHALTVTAPDSSTTTKLLVSGAEIRGIESGQGFAASTFASDKAWIDIRTGEGFEVGNSTPLADGTILGLRFEMVVGGSKPTVRIIGLVDGSSVASGPAKVLSQSCWGSFGK